MVESRHRVSGGHYTEHTLVPDDPGNLRISLLGRFEVSVGSRVIREDGWRLRKAASVVKLLALSPDHSLHREQVMNLLWPDLGARAAVNNLHQALHVARRTLEPEATAYRYLPMRGEQLALCPEDSAWVDVKAFERAAREAGGSRQPTAYREALDLYSGNLLPRDRYEEWAESRREELRRTYLALLFELATVLEERGALDRAVETLQEIVSHEPAHEEAHVGLMRVYARAGQRYRALRQYEHLRRTLRLELGTEPHAASRHAYEEIVAGHVPVAGTPSVSSGSESPETGLHNLPSSLTSFVGREREKEEIERLLGNTRLLTLTGTGGCGKTRLAQEVARDLTGAYPDGVWWVELAPLTDPELVPQAVADALSVREQPGSSLETTLVDALRGKDLLLALDNCEHLVDACALFVETLLRSCPRVRILATSREFLGAAGELVWQVPSLSAPASYPRPSVEELEGYESVCLFVQRARYRNPAFILDPQNAGAVMEICRRLDGVPLAIELAAARVGFSVQEIAARLDDSLRLLTTGSRTATPRQRTLRGALAWSYELLGESEQVLFGRLSVFAGGFTLEAAEAVSSGEGIEEQDVMDLLSRLVDKSLVVAEAGGNGAVRYRMLEPVRQYARESLRKGDETDTVRRRHATFFLTLAEEAGPELIGQRQRFWLDRLEAEQDNLRAALSYCLETGNADMTLRLAGTLGGFWQMRGHLAEGRRWLEAALAVAETPVPARVNALTVAAYIAWEQGDYERSTAASEECLVLSRTLDHRPGIAAALFNLGSVALFRNEHEKAAAYLEEAVALQRELGDTTNLARTLQPLGLVAVVRRDYDRAAALYEENLALARQVEDDIRIVLALGLGALATLGRGDHERVRELLEEGLRLAQHMGYRHAIAFHLHVAAVLAGLQGKPARSARLWGAAEALREEVGTTLSPVELYHYGPYIAAARARVDEATWDEAWAEGRTLTLEEAFEYALSLESTFPSTTVDLPPARSEAGRSSTSLTPREREIALLVAQGFTNRRISEELSISERTVATHVGRILKKLGLGSRSRLAAWITAQGQPPSDPA